MAAETGQIANDFVVKTINPVEELVENAVVLSPVHPAFRDFTVDFYQNLFESFVWMAFASRSDFEPAGLFAFFVTELAEGKEVWRVEAALRGMVAIVRYFPEMIASESIEISLSLVLLISTDMGNLIEKTVVRYLTALCGRKKWTSKIFNSLLYLSLKIGFSGPQMARILASSQLNQNAIFDISEAVLASSTISSEEKLALLRICLMKDANISYFVSENLNGDPGFGCEGFKLCLRYGSGVNERKIEEFLSGPISKWSLCLAGEIVARKSAAGIGQFVNRAFHEFDAGRAECVAFIALFIRIFGSVSEVAEGVLRLLLGKLARGSGLSESVCLVNELRRVNDSFVRKYWAEIERKVRQSIFASLAALA
jgi:hypothetical protein